MENRLVYADNAATTALSETALTAMLPYFTTFYGNASSAHSLGHESKKALEDARGRVAKCLNARNNEIFFTSGGSESDNWALYGSLLRPNARGRHIIVSSIEHSAVFRAAEFLETRGCEVTYLPVDKYGRVRPEQLEEAIRDNTALVSVMLANNEIGTIQPIRELCEIAHRRRVPFHTDAVQAVGHIPVDVRELGVDMLSLSAHKFRGPKGVGALYVKSGYNLPPVVIGGGQEKNKRSGTENVPGVVGMAAALDEAVSGMTENIARIEAMRDRVIRTVELIDGAALTGDSENRLPGIASFLFMGLESTAIVAGLSNVGICASSGSACSSGSTELIRALGETVEVTAKEAGGALRLSFNERNTEEDIGYIIQKLPEVIGQLKAPQTLPF